MTVEVTFRALGALVSATGVVDGLSGAKPGRTSYVDEWVLRRRVRWSGGLRNMGSPGRGVGHHRLTHATARSVG
ncbi:hypothetical protein [Actinomadura rubrisoli]|uniref:Uncharacterized protein n=1 Tax=Actinomadura rubrisoli TaxID=2530368 RepID=A0A4R5AW21_9ACTN|nr:hypothetical protein [Actinomadura rubrisoli]TDD77628.1 hypothetical protein E1298_29910 [Actinomadura rubrisoli]